MVLNCRKIRLALRRLSRDFYCLQIESKIKTYFLCSRFIGVLWDFFTIVWLREISNRKVVPETWFDCKLSWFFYGFFVHMSSAMLVIMCVEKCFALYFPHKAKVFCTVNNAKWISLGTGTAFFIFDGQWFFAISATKDQFGTLYCQIKDQHYRHIFPYVDSALYTFIPACLMFILNCAIIIKLILKTGMTVGKGTSKIAKQGTLMLLMVTTVFIILTMPAGICWLSMYNTHHAPFLFAMSFLLHMLNHSINALLYIVTGSKYREGIRRLLRCRSIRIMSITGSNSPANTGLINNISRSKYVLQCTDKRKINDFKSAPKLDLNTDAQGANYFPRSPYDVPLYPLYWENPIRPKTGLDQNCTHY